MSSHVAPSMIVLRVARPTDRLAEVTQMYVDGLGLSVLGTFADHAGFDGSILGSADAPYHLEFTTRRGHRAGEAPSRDHLLVFYIPDRAEWEARATRLTAAGFREVPSYNPYWDVTGRTFEDVDGYRVVLQNERWSP